MSKLVDAELDQTVTVTENGKPVKLTKRQLIAKGLVNDAAKGNLKALDAMIRLVGTAPRSEGTLVAIDPAILASFLARHAPSLQGQGGDR